MRPHHATDSFTISCVKSQSDCLPSPTVAESVQRKIRPGPPTGSPAIKRNLASRSCTIGHPPGREDGAGRQPWLTIVIDDYSRAVAGYFLGFDPPSSTRTALALRQAIWRKAIHIGRCAVSRCALYRQWIRFYRRSTSNRSLSISKSSSCSRHQGSRKGVAASSAFSERSTNVSLRA